MKIFGAGTSVPMTTYTETVLPNPSPIAPMLKSFDVYLGDNMELKLDYNLKINTNNTQSYNIPNRWSRP
jgi:hypothetical protein